MRQRFLTLGDTLISAVGNRKITTALIIATLCLFTLYISDWSHAKRPPALERENAQCPPCPGAANYSSWNYEMCDPPETHWSCTECGCVVNPSPVLVDILGNGFAL